MLGMFVHKETKRKQGIMQVHKCRCLFVPPFVLENMARAGIEEARLTIQQSMLSREKRAEGPKDMEMFAGVTPVGRAHRQIYNSQNMWKKRVEPVFRSEGDPVRGDEAVDKSYDYIGNVRDFFKKKLNRNSIDNNGMDLICNVHYGTKYNNAFWDGDEITLGDGDGKIFVNFAKSLDVVAHELGHGVVQWTANFVYQKQPGALHEHFADVFGSVITQHVEGQTAEDADWLIGDEIMGPELYGEALRSMCAPGTAYDDTILGKDPQPDHMKDYYTGSGDNYGVHINSGIPNKAFCLAAQKIGSTDKAALIWYTALQNLWSTADFNDAVEQIVKATRLLIKDGKVEKGAVQKVRAAFKAVGLPTP
jgi:Zn-dependent metalloprotease